MLNVKLWSNDLESQLSEDAHVMKSTEPTRRIGNRNPYTNVDVTRTQAQPEAVPLWQSAAAYSQPCSSYHPHLL